MRDLDIESFCSWPLDIKWPVCLDLIDIQEVLKQSVESGSHSYKINTYSIWLQDQKSSVEFVYITILYLK